MTKALKVQPKNFAIKWILLLPGLAMKWAFKLTLTLLVEYEVMLDVR